MADICDQIIESIEAARRNREPLSIVAGASKRFLGRTSNGSPLEVAAHEGIVSYEPGELVLAARAGTRLTEIEATLAERGQALQFEPPSFDGAATIGGTLACNMSGPARPWSGSVRDAVLGIELVTGRAERLRFGGRVMKNVAGFDVSRLQAGALGAFGVITEVSLKVLPRPRHTVTLVRALDAADAIVHMNKLAGTAKPMSGACWHDGSLYVRFSGAESAVEAAAGQRGGERLDPAATSRRSEAHARDTANGATRRRIRSAAKRSTRRRLRSAANRQTMQPRSGGTWPSIGSSISGPAHRSGASRFRRRRRYRGSTANGSSTGAAHSAGFTATSTRTNSNAWRNRRAAT